VKAYGESGMLSAAQDYDIGGMQPFYTVESAANAFFAKASAQHRQRPADGAMRTRLMAHGTERRSASSRSPSSAAAGPARCLSEPQAGSSLSDISTRAVPDGEDFESNPLGPRYRITGNKMWISAGEHELTENIIHLVLAKIPGPDGKPIPGTKGISLFIVTKKLVDTTAGSPASATMSRSPA
jgi:butyryl-CoA dehydrogenase